MFGWVESVRTVRGAGGGRLVAWVESVRSFGRDQAARNLGWGGPQVDRRAELLGRMIALLVQGLKTQSYDDFVARFSNPGRAPDALQRLSRKARFQMRISPTCWYDAAVCYADDSARTLSLTGGGDDFGVAIAAGSAAERIAVAFAVDYGDTPGRDARAMVRALAKLPGFRRGGEGDAARQVEPPA